MSDIFRMRGSRQLFSRNASYGCSRRHIAGDDSSGTDTASASDIDVVHYADTRADIDIVADMGRPRGVGAYGRELSEIDIIPDDSSRIYHQSVAVLDIKAIADDGARRYEETVAFLVATGAPSRKWIEPSAMVLGETEPEREADADAAPSRQPDAEETVFAAIVAV